MPRGRPEQAKSTRSLGPLQQSGLAVGTVRTWKGESVPRDAAGIAGLVVMGRSTGVYEAGRFPNLAVEIDLVRDALRRGRPILWLCLGSAHR